MSEVKKIMICGFPGSGKSGLFRFLDGHPQLLGTQVYERFLSMFTDGKNEFVQFSNKTKLNIRSNLSKMKFKLRLDGEIININICHFRWILTNYTSYHVIEEDAENGFTYNSYTSKKHSAFEFEFDFSEFERNWKQMLFSDGAVQTPETVIDALYLSFFKAWKNYPVQYGSDTCIVFADVASKKIFRFLLEEDFNIKIIFVNRETEGVFATKALRYNLSESERKVDSNIKELLVKKEAVRIGNERCALMALAEKHPEKIRVFEFEYMIMNIDEVLNLIMEFLGIEPNNILAYPSHLKVRLEGQYVGKINDDWCNILEKKDVAVIHFQSGKKSLNQIVMEFGVGRMLYILQIEIEHFIKKVLAKLSKIV